MNYVVTSIFIGVVYERESAAAESESHPMREERTEHAVCQISVTEIGGYVSGLRTAAITQNIGQITGSG